jgi:hypothetical protein
VAAAAQMSHLRMRGLSNAESAILYLTQLCPVHLATQLRTPLSYQLLLQSGATHFFFQGYEIDRFHLCSTSHARVCHWFALLLLKEPFADLLEASSQCAVELSLSAADVFYSVWRMVQYLNLKLRLLPSSVSCVSHKCSSMKEL